MGYITIDRENSDPELIARWDEAIKRIQAEKAMTLDQYVFYLANEMLERKMLFLFGAEREELFNKVVDALKDKN